MKVILLQEVKGKGVEGDVIEVAGGFADNYLLPNKIAVKATKGNLKQLEQRRNNIEKREAGRIAAAEELKTTLNNAVVKIEARVGEEGTLFGSVTNQMVAEAVASQLGIEIDRRLIEIKNAIKVAGDHEVIVSLHRDIKATLKLLVGSAEMLTAADEKAEEAVEVEEQPEEATEAVAE